MGAQENFYLLSRLFSTRLFVELIRRGHSRLLMEIWKNSRILSTLPDQLPFSDIISIVYSFLQKNYQNEYIYKNILVNKILLGIHSLNTSFMISELPVASCKADMVILNGTSTVYEIKTELDSLDRLERQICAYKKAFDMINVVTSDRHGQIQPIEELLPREIGIISLTAKGTLRTIRPPVSNVRNVDREVIFNILQKREYLSIIKKYYGAIPDVPNTQIYKAAKSKFQMMPVEDIHKEMVGLLKARGKSLSAFIQKVPTPLKALAIKSHFSAKERQCCLALLSQPVSELLTY